MDPHEEQELEESLDFMRKQFQALTDDIRIPDSLRADLLKKQLELLEAEQEEEEERARRRKRPAGKAVRFPLRSMMGAAACILVVGVSFLSYQLGRASNGSALEGAGGPASSSAAPMAAAEPAAVSPELFSAPVPDGPENAPVPEAAPAQAQAPSPRMAVMPEDAPAERAAGVPEDAGTVAEDADEVLPAEELYEEYLPEALPEGLELSVTAAGEDSLSASYLNEDYSRQVQLILRPLFRSDSANVVNPAASESYDLRLYTLPYADSVPEELAAVVNNPVFRLEDLSLTMVESRIFDSSGSGQSRGNFSVLFPAGVVAEFNVTGVSAAEIYAMIAQMNV